MLKFICLYCYININTYICHALINKFFKNMGKKYYKIEVCQDGVFVGSFGDEFWDDEDIEKAISKRFCSDNWTHYKITN